MGRAFVIRPFGRKKDGAGREIDFDAIHVALVEPALAAAGFAGGDSGEIVEAGNIREDMFSLIIEADLIVCDITVHNANVFYELGIRQALRKKGGVLIRGTPSADATPFDILTDRYLAYDLTDPAASMETLVQVIRATVASDRPADSPIFKMLPSLPELDPATVGVLPQDLSEEVARAAAARSVGWLRLLAEEVRGRRFEREALRLIGRAQWALKDVAGARRSWEKVLDRMPGDIEVNLALATLHEREYRATGRLDRLEAANQAIARALDSGRATPTQRAEALSLRGRNAKSRWRLEFEHLPDLAARREQATNRRLLKAYQAYREAYLVDLNHYWSGLAALQMGRIALDLSNGPAWEDAFERESQAQACKQELEAQLRELQATVSLAVQAELSRLPPDHKDRLWPEISAADLLFLNGESSRKVANAYRDAIPLTNVSAWHSARGQLELFVSLGIRSVEAAAVIADVEARRKEAEPEPGLHVVVFAGHRVDEPGRASPRFPADREPRARQLLQEVLLRFQAEASRLRVLASAAPGADLICHELCRELGIEAVICLPMPQDDFARLAFGPLDRWRSRYLHLLDGRTLLELSDKEGLPRWLRDSGANPWERGNRWVLEMARGAGARRITVLVLWDGQPEGDAPGGTAHMVRIAREAGAVELVTLDLDQMSV